MGSSIFTMITWIRLLESVSSKQVLPILLWSMSRVIIVVKCNAKDFKSLLLSLYFNISFIFFISFLIYSYVVVIFSIERKFLILCSLDLLHLVSNLGD